MESPVLEDITTIGFEDARVCLPTHVLHEAFDPKENLWPDQPEKRRFHGVDSYFPARKVSQNQHYYNKAQANKLHPRPRFQTQRASGGPGMQAIFLDSSQKSCGTGFFLPRGIGNNVQSSKKPACSPVLLPARVIQALNLNVHALGTQISPRESDTNITRSGVKDLDNRKYDSRDSEATVSTKGCVNSVSNHRSSPEIFLPKEWSY